MRSPRWQRTNHAGDPVTLLEGPAYVAGAALGAATSGPAGVGRRPAASGAFGALDDLAGDGAEQGAAGPPRCRRPGPGDTGLVKIVGHRRHRPGRRCTRRPAARDDVRALDTLVGGAVVAGAANLANLLDLRPGPRAQGAPRLRVPAAAARPRRRGRHRRAAAATGAARSACSGPDLAGTAMLGDTGANAAGALVGTALLGVTGRRGRLAALAVLAGLTLASEKVSFTRVIESTPGLRELDAWGRPAR